MIKFTAIPITLDAAAGDAESPRTITGIAVPWDVKANVSSGESVLFLRGAFDTEGKRPKLLENHDPAQLRGVVVELADSAEGLLFTAKFAKTRASDDAIELVKAGAYDSVSVGAYPVKYKIDGSGTMIVSEARLEEISLVSSPAFPEAQITQIAASEPDLEVEPEVIENPTPDISEEETMSTETPVVEASAPDAIPTAPLFASARREFVMPSAAEWIAASVKGGPEFEQLNANIRAAAPDVKTTDTVGILPVPILQPVYNNFRGLRPVVDAIGAKAMPLGGKVFIRPSVTTHTSMAVQSAESATLQSGTFVVTSNQVTKGSYGGYVSVSEQDMDWTDPAVVGLILDDMSRIYSNATDNVAADALLAGCTQTAVLTDPTSAAEWVSDIYDASVTILNNSNGNLPGHLFLSPDMFGYLGKLVDTAGRPLFPQVGPMNAFGSISPGAAYANPQAFGLTVVVDRNFAAGTVIVGNADGFEIFEEQKGAISVDVPQNLTRTLAFRGYFATLMIDATKFVSLT